mgnify:CR=1 FL=1
METNHDIDVSGTNVQMFGDRRDLKVICYPGQNEIIKFNMIFYCSIAHPTLMFKSTSFTKYPIKFVTGKMEDYTLWIKLILEDGFKFANIGIILLKLRKHVSNKSLEHTL